MTSKLAGSLGLLIMLQTPLWAQDMDDADPSQRTEIDELEPAVSSSALSQMAAESDDADAAPAPEATVAEGVTRQQGSTGVMDRIDLGRTEITGNQELPKVLYIVPWQKSGPAELIGKPVNTLLDEVLAPIDRTEFVRQVDYYDELYGEEQE